MELQKTGSYAKAYVEILEIINYMGKEYKEKVPPKLLKHFEENRDPNYVYKFGDTQMGNNQIFSTETIGLLSMLEYRYWANDDEKKALKESLEKNEKNYQDCVNEKYNPKNIFGNKK